MQWIEFQALPSTLLLGPALESDETQVPTCSGLKFKYCLSTMLLDPTLESVEDLVFNMHLIGFQELMPS